MSNENKEHEVSERSTPEYRRKKPEVGNIQVGRAERKKKTKKTGTNQQNLKKCHTWQKGKNLKTKEHRFLTFVRRNEIQNPFLVFPLKADKAFSMNPRSWMVT